MNNRNPDPHVEQIFVQRRPTALQSRDLLFTGIILTLVVIFLSKTLESSVIGNLQILAMIMAPIGIVAIGQTLVVITGGVDLSVGSIAALTGIIIARLTARSMGVPELLNPWIAAVIGLALATGMGWLNGLLISRYKLAPFIVTFGSLSLFRGLAQVISNGSTINLNTGAFSWLWDNAFGLIPVPLILMLILSGVLAYLLHNSRFGRYAYAIGSNETVARLSGIDVDRTRQLVYATSGFLAGLVGLLLMVHIEAGAYSSGQDYELQSIAAVIIGGTSLKGGHGGVWGTLGGILMLAIVKSSFVLFSVPSQWNQVITGAIILGAALIEIQRRRIQDTALSPTVTPTTVPVASANNLEQALNRFVRGVQARCQCQTVKVYLLDRDSGKLVEPLSQSPPSSILASQVMATGKPIVINDLVRDSRHEARSGVQAMRSAAAIPILLDGRLIGVVELQSPVPETFGDVMVESIMAITMQMANTLEDNWLLEGGWLIHQVRDSLRNLSDDIYLEQCALAGYLLPASNLINQAETLRQMLLGAVEHLRPAHTDLQPRAMRRYQVLRQTYVEQKNVDAILHDLGLSRRQYFYDLKEAIDVVVHHLITERRFRQQNIPQHETVIAT
jgi:ribose/xylose/arabinose/galactoside ABC-type transport system permease subunit